MTKTFEGKLTALFRKLEFNGKTYYQCDFVVPETTPGNRFDNLNNRLSSNKLQFYDTGTEEELNAKGFKEKTIFYEDNGLVVVSDEEEKKLVSSKFEEIMPIKAKGNELENKIDDCVNKIFDETKCQKGATRELVQTIFFNRDLNDSNLPSRDKYLMHDNICFYGPTGSGKTMVLESLKKHLDMPVIEIEFDEDVNVNKELIVDALLNADKEFDGNAVVICDLDFNKFDAVFQGDSFYPLKELCNLGNEYHAYKLKKPVNFRNLTFICCMNVANKIYERAGNANLDGYFVHASGCGKPVGVQKLNLLQARKVLLESTYSKLKFCKKIAEENHRSFYYDPTTLAYLLKNCYDNHGNIVMIDTAIMESFKLQFRAGVKDIIIGNETLGILRGIMGDDEPEDEYNEEEEEELEDNNDNNNYQPSMTVSDAIQDKEKAIDDLSEKIKEIIKGQDDQVKDIATAIIDNQEIAHDPKEKYPESNKVNILIRGASGTGKTEIIRIIAKNLGIPMVVEDATRYTEEGYVGESVTEMLLDLYRESGEDIEKTERGIIVIDELDKKAGGERANIDVSRSAVLNALLKMIEGETYQLEYKIPSPMGMMMKKIKIDTRRMTFIGLGAFDGLDQIKEKRIKKAEKPESMGFKSKDEQEAVAKKLDGINRDFVNKDYIEFGFTDQFINRFDEKVYLNKIDRNTMIEIMKYSAKSPLLLLQNRYANYGIEIEYTEDFYEKLADIAMTKDSGARSIKEVFADLRKFVGFNRIKKSDYSKITFNAECFDRPDALQLTARKGTKKLQK